jgi:hypothetical protein
MERDFRRLRVRNRVAFRSSFGAPKLPLAPGSQPRRAPRDSAVTPDGFVFKFGITAHPRSPSRTFERFMPALTNEDLTVCRAVAARRRRRSILENFHLKNAERAFPIPAVGVFSIGLQRHPNVGWILGSGVGPSGRGCRIIYLHQREYLFGAGDSRPG